MPADFSIGSVDASIDGVAFRPEEMVAARVRCW
jgi:hypothetical protein